MYRTLAATALASFMALAPAQATTLNEVTFGEFGNTFNAPTDFTGAAVINATSNGTQDYEYFRFDTLFPDTTALTFTLTNLGAGSNMNIRLSSTPFSMAEWDWTITPLAPNQELYSNGWNGPATFQFLVPANFTGPLFGFARFYNTSSPSTLVITQNGTPPAAPVPLPASALLLLGGLFGVVALRKARRAV